ncbi:MAG: haloacid dehalogenase [Thermoprotei archaeon]
MKERVRLLGGKAVEECGTAISLLHRGRVEEAKKLLSSVKKRAALIVKLCSAHPVLLRMPIIRDMNTEYVEATCYYHFLAEGKIPPYTSFNVEPDEYILGLADLIGELRRRCLDLIRMGKYELASKTFDQMVETYEYIWRFEYPKKLVKGLRHKVDVDRKLLEDTRLILTQAHILAR